jgi:hypothetical protein
VTTTISRFSIEARHKVGQGYAAILGFFRQYELIFITGDERDIIRLPTNYRKDEQVFMYRTTVPAERARKIFSVYADYRNQLKDHPEWYNALTETARRRSIPGTLRTLRIPDPGITSSS